MPNETRVEEQAQPEDQAQPVLSERFKNQDPITIVNEETVLPTDLVVHMPPAAYSNLEEFKNHLSVLTEEEISRLYTTEETEFLKGQYAASMLLYPSYVYEGLTKKKDNTLSNDIRYAQKHIGITPLPTLPAPGERNNKKGVARFVSVFKAGEVSEIPLYHSGFWVSINPPALTSIVRLQSAITTNIIKAGRDTNTIAFNNYSAIAIRLLLDFIVEHIASSSLILPPNADIRTYISGNDIPALVLGLLASEYPKGPLITQTCGNAVTKGVDGKFKCDFQATARVNLPYLLNVDSAMVTDEMLLTISKKADSSVTIEEVLEYQSRLDHKLKRTVDLNINGSILTMVLEIPNALNTGIHGEQWINRVIKKTEELFTAADTAYSKETKVKAILNTVIAGIYNSVIKELRTSDEIVNKRSTINEILDELSKEPTVADMIIEECHKFISDSAITVIGIPMFICPTCKKQHTGDDSLSAGLREIIPINVIEYFFVLSSLHSELLISRN